MLPMSFSHVEVLVQNTVAGCHHFSPASWGNDLPYGHKWLTHLSEAEHTLVHREFSDYLFKNYGKYFMSQSGAAWRTQLGWKERYKLLIDFYRSYDLKHGTNMFSLLMKEVRDGVRGGYNPLGR